MGFTATYPRPEKTHPTAKNRVWGFFAEPSKSRPANRLQPPEPRRKIAPTPTKPASGVFFYGYRYYDPVTGRWPSRDPIGEAGGLNLYAFVRNQGVHLIDRLGLDPIAPNAGDGWNPVPGRPGTSKKPARDFWDDDLNSDQKEPGVKTYRKGCMGITMCMLGLDDPADLFDEGTTCFPGREGEQKAVDFAKTKECPKGQKPQIFAVEHLGESGEIDPDDGTVDIPSDRVLTNWAKNGGQIPFDFGFRQSDGSYIHADRGGGNVGANQFNFNVYISEDSNAFVDGFPQVAFCVRCGPCVPGSDSDPAGPPSDTSSPTGGSRTK